MSGNIQDNIFEPMSDIDIKMVSSYQSESNFILKYQSDMLVIERVVNTLNKDKEL
jgi:hypothetical protein